VRPAGLNLIMVTAASDWGVRQWGFYPVEGPAGRSQFRWMRNDCTLFEGMVGHGWSSTLSLARCDITGVGLTLRFTTAATRHATDRRRLGIALSRVVLN
jgi:hypothetical protein